MNIYDVEFEISNHVTVLAESVQQILNIFAQEKYPEIVSIVRSHKNVEVINVTYRSISSLQDVKEKDGV